MANGAYVLDGSDRVEIDGITRLLQAIGRTPEVVSGIDPAAVGDGIVWVPESARNQAATATQATEALRRGARLVMAGPSDTASEVGLSFGPGTVRLQGERYVADPTLKVTWAQSRTTWTVHDSRNDYVAATTPDGREPVAITGTVGSGRFLWMAVGAGAGAAERFPLLPLMLRDLLGVSPSSVSRQGIDLYVDPGLISGTDPEALADRWLTEGVRRVYIAAWEFGFASGSAPYDAYIAAAHSRGIAAYAWLEPPVVNDSFYAAHPECHEKTATGRDAVGDWRKLVALEDPACFAGAVAAYNQVLSAHDWDGVDVAELYFEAPLAGPERPDLYTPMSAWVREDFKARYGFDPAEIFNPASSRFYGKSHGALDIFTGYRSALVTDLHRRLLEALPQKLPVVVTTIDDKLAPETARNVGVDLPALRKLAGSLRFQIQYEDPFTAWTQGPQRYDRLHGLYPAGMVFDVNVVPRPGGLPTSVPTGSELLVTLAAAASRTGEVALYADGTVPSRDTPWLAGAVAAGASTVSSSPHGELDVSASFTVRVQGPTGARSAEVDGKPWPLVDAGGGALIPAGTHLVSFSSAPGPRLGLGSCSCEITAAHMDGESIAVDYTSPSRAWLVLDNAPANLTVDGQAVNISNSSPDRTVIALPAGDHAITVP